jgi:hypothetical protein
MAPNTFVHCHLPNIDQTDKYQGVSRTIAVNGAQYGGSAACGMCAEVWGSGKLCDGGVQGPDCGLGQQGNAIHERFLAVVTDELWERGYGDIDIGVQGDGKYPVQWKPVPCPWAKTNARLVLHAGSSVNYIKAQMRYMDSGMKWMKNEGSGEVSNYRFHDNFLAAGTRKESSPSAWSRHSARTIAARSTARFRPSPMSIRRGRARAVGRGFDISWGVSVSLSFALELYIYRCQLRGRGRAGRE